MFCALTIGVCVWLPRPVPLPGSCGTSTILRSWETIRRLICFVEKQQQPVSEVRAGHSLTKARGTLPGKWITWESNSHDCFQGQGKGIYITPKLHVDLFQFALCMVFSGTRPGSRLGTLVVCLMELLSPTAIAPFASGRKPSSNPAFQGPAMETRTAVSSVLVCWPRDPDLEQCLSRQERGQ